MKKFWMYGVAASALMMLASDAQAQRRGGGGAVSGGVRGAAVGGMFGGEGGAEKGAKLGVAAGATRGVVERTADRQAMNAEAQTRATYVASTEYQNAQHSNFTEMPPEVVASSQSGQPVTTTGEIVLSKDGKPIVGITYPSDWKPKVSDRYATAVSNDGNAWSAIAILEDINDKQAGIKKVKEQLENYLTEIKYDEPTETKRGGLLVTGKGKTKKTGVEVVFAAGVADSGSGQFVGAAFVVDGNIENHYKETVRCICQSIRNGSDIK